MFQRERVRGREREFVERLVSEGICIHTHTHTHRHTHTHTHTHTASQNGLNADVQTEENTVSEENTFSENTHVFSRKYRRPDVVNPLVQKKK